MRLATSRICPTVVSAMTAEPVWIPIRTASAGGRKRRRRMASAGRVRRGPPGWRRPRAPAGTPHRHQPVAEGVVQPTPNDVLTNRLQLVASQEVVELLGVQLVPRALSIRPGRRRARLPTVALPLCPGRPHLPYSWTVQVSAVARSFSFRPVSRQLRAVRLRPRMLRTGTAAALSLMEGAPAKPSRLTSHVPVA